VLSWKKLLSKNKNTGIFNEFVYKNQFAIEIDIYIYNLLNKITKKNAMQDCIY
jgi:hypothetical protein